MTVCALVIDCFCSSLYLSSLIDLLLGFFCGLTEVWCRPGIMVLRRAVGGVDGFLR